MMTQEYFRQLEEATKAWRTFQVELAKIPGVRTNEMTDEVEVAPKAQAAVLALLERWQNGEFTRPNPQENHANKNSSMT